MIRFSEPDVTDDLTTTGVGRWNVVNRHFRNAGRTERGHGVAGRQRRERQSDHLHSDGVTPS